MQRTLRGFLVLTFALVVITGCGRGGGTPAASRPRPTPIPLPTPLPPLPTLPPPGSEENPIQIMLVSPDGSDLEKEATSLGEALSTETEMTIIVTVTDNYAKARKALCNGQAGLISASAIAYLAAKEAGCGDALYTAEIDGATATQGQLLAGVGREIFTVKGFAGYRFCRPDPNSVNGWIVPGLAMRAAGFNPLTDLFSITDAGSDRAVVEKMIAFRCDIGASAKGAEEGVPGNDGVFVVQELPLVPNDTIMISSRLDESIKAVITDALRSHLTDLAGLMGVDSLTETDDSAFTGLRDLFEKAGVSPASMGQ